MSTRSQLITLIALLSILGSSYAQDQLRTRHVVDFNAGWLFEQDDWVGLNNASHLDWDDSRWLPVQLPHSFNAEDTFDPPSGYYRGFAWYRKHFSVDKSYDGRILKLHFGAIGNESEIWVNEHYMGKFFSGYTPVEIDITDVIKREAENLIAIRVNNLHNDEVPPGRWRMDYNVYGGIYREVTLVSLAPVHLVKDDLHITTPEVSEKTCLLNIQAGINNGLNRLVRAKIVCRLMRKGMIVSEFGEERTAPSGIITPVKGVEARIEDVSLWSPDDPALYQLQVQLVADGTVIDELITSIGFRQFHFDPENGFFLNGNPLKLRGLNRHQCFPGLANAVPKRLQVMDAVILKDLGANFVRCAHYPQHESFLDACDSLGLLVYEEAASWQHIGGDVFIDHMDQMFNQMIRRDRNHPSIILWGMMNEGRSVKMLEKMARTGHELDPGRPVTYAENHIDVAEREGTIFIPDVLGLNYNLQAYDELHASYPSIPLINTECTNADKVQSGNSESQLLAVSKISGDLDYLDARPFIAGACIWGFHDYGTEYKPVRPIQRSGVVDEYRQYKEAAWYLKSRWSSEPSIHIAGHWQADGNSGAQRQIHIWHNCEDVEVTLNGREVKKIADHLWETEFEPGTLKAVGRKGKATVRDALFTAGKPHQIVCSPKSQNLKADGFDALVITAGIYDESGHLVPVNDCVIMFEVDGPAKLVGIGGQSNIPTADGLANIVLQSTGEPGRITIKTKSKNLTGKPLIVNAL